MLLIQRKSQVLFVYHVLESPRVSEFRSPRVPASPPPRVPRSHVPKSPRPTSHVPVPLLVTTLIFKAERVVVPKAARLLRRIHNSHPWESMATWTERAIFFIGLARPAISRIMYLPVKLVEITSEARPRKHSRVTQCRSKGRGWGGPCPPSFFS